MNALPQDQPPAARPTHFRWVVFALGCGTSWLLYLHRLSFGVIKPELQREFGWEPVQLGFADTVFSIFYAVFQLPVGILADVAGAQFVLPVIIVIWSAALAGYAGVYDLRVLWAALAVLGIGQAGAYAALSRVSRNWFPVTVRTRVQGWMAVFFGRLGGACAPLVLATLLMGTLSLSWREGVLVMSLLGAVLAVAFAIFFRDDPRRHPWVNAAEAKLIASEPCDPNANATTSDTSPPKKLSIRQMLRQTRGLALLNLLALAFQTSLSTIADDVYKGWIPLFLKNVHHLEYKKLGFLAMLPLLGGAVGGAVGGYLNDWLIARWKSRRWSRVAVGVAGKGLAGAMLVVALAFYDRPYVFCTWLLVVKFFSDWSLSSTWGTVTDIGGRASASVFAFNNSVATVAGTVAPLLYGSVAQYFGWKISFMIVASVYAVCAASWLLVDCTRSVMGEAKDG